MITDNHFTIEYIKCLEKHLKISVLDNETYFFPEYVTNEDIINLKLDLDNIWDSSQTSIDLLQEKKDSKLQAGLFGLVEDFELAVRSGFLLADRVVVLDFIFQRMLRDIDKVNKITLGEAARNLVKMKGLAQQGRFVIIPSPFFWHKETKIFIQQAAEKYDLTPENISLLNILSICKSCNLQPYTIAENQNDFDVLLKDDIELSELTSQTSSISSYNSILGGLMSQKILNIEELGYIQKVPINKFASEIRESKNFYSEYSKLITHNGATNFESNFDELKEKIVLSVKQQNKTREKKFLDKISKISTIGTAGIALADTIVAISAPILLVAATVTLGSTIAGMFISEDKKEDIVISVLKKLNSD